MTAIEALTYTYDKKGNRITQLRQNAVASNLPTAVAAANIGINASAYLVGYYFSNDPFEPTALGAVCRQWCDFWSIERGLQGRYPVAWPRH